MERHAMVSFTEIEQRVLSELEEAGAEDSITLLNTVFLPTGNIEEASDFTSALTSLIRRGMALMSVYTNVRKWSDTSPAESVKIAEQLPAHLQFNEVQNLWHDTRNPGPPTIIVRLPMVVCTTAGKKKAFDILDERGYQWWRKK